MADSFYMETGRSLKSSSENWYRVVQVLGVGGNAVTFLTMCTSGANKGVPFALKVFRRLSLPERRERFLAEIAFLKDCNHPSVMRVFDDGLYEMQVEEEEVQYPFLVAEYLPKTLRNVLDGQGTTQAEKLAFASQLLSALCFLNSRTPPVVHRDIKPQNIFVKGRSCLLGDFGLLKVLDNNAERDREVFKESVGPGMPFFYRTPDLVAYARNESDITSKSDVFQLGLVLAELFTGRNPCRRPLQNDHLTAVEIENLNTIPGVFGAGIAALIRRMLNPNPIERPDAATLMDGWLGVFQDCAARLTELDGKVFE